MAKLKDGYVPARPVEVMEVHHLIINKGMICEERHHFDTKEKLIQFLNLYLIDTLGYGIYVLRVDIEIDHISR